MSREYSAEEVKEQFLDYIRDMVRYWSKIQLSKGKGPTSQEEDIRARLDGLAFSILVALDGGAADLPNFQVMCDPHPENKPYCQEEGLNWYPEGAVLPGSLHESYAAKKV